jgi:exopolysaccharide production protein ExoY
MQSFTELGDGEVSSSKGEAVGGAAKRAFDLVFAGLAVAFLIVLIAVIAGAISCLDGQPIFIRHRRVGRNGRFFDCLKFRTMVNNADAVLQSALSADPRLREEWAETRKLRRDPRVTKLGRLLRKSSLDELPQLFNILRGEMSIVGPRPIVEEEVARYGMKIALYNRARPGLTGAWQISGRNDVSYTARVALDSEYIENWSLINDIAIVAKTIPAVLSARGVY